MIFAYVRHHQVIDFLALGWVISDTFEDVCHGQYSVLMRWLCDCPCARPMEHDAEAAE